ncbi:MAG: hypothetical protein JNJ60_19935 [Rhodocyclaceae bacterium]|nr:hypothetical protein [Rhodocyclaceae bacterium]
MGPGMGMHRGMGPGMGGPYGHWRATRSNTPGYGLMTPEERSAHVDKMRSMQSADECKAYLAEHHARMVERAKEKGVAAPAMRGDPCRVAPPAAKK